MDFCTVAIVAAFMAGFMAGLLVIYLIMAARTTRKLPVIINGVCEVIE